MSFSDFWERVDVDPLLSVIPHFTPQTALLRNAPLTGVLRHETMAEDFADLAARYEFDQLRELPKAAESPKVVVTDDARKRILKVYAADVSFFYPHLKLQ
jgi:hypothetical protein